MTLIRKSAAFAAAILLTALVAPTVEAHFMWLKLTTSAGQPAAFLHFGEDPADEQYNLPEAIAKAELWRRTVDGKRTKLDAKRTAEGDDRIGLVAGVPDGEPCMLEASARYGNYHGSLLTYWSKHIHAPSIAALNRMESSKELKLDVIPSVRGDELRLTVLWNGEPLPDATVTVAVGEGEGVELKTDRRGRASLRPESEGLVSVLASRRDAEAQGEHNGEAYTGEMDFVSLTFAWRKPRVFAQLPAPLASFGAAVADGWLYVYGGHVGEPHDHSAANLSAHFRRVRQDGSGDWEELPMQTALQGVALASHGGLLYRVGGMSARNATTEAEEDMHSTDEFACYHPSQRKWTALPALPGARSSHDAVVIGDKLYVVGGWKLAGKSGGGEWQKDLLVFDLAHSISREAAWRKLPGLANSRRALAAGEWKGKLAVIGGIDEDGAVSRETTFFDPHANEWTDGPQLPEGDLAGFGVSAWNLDGRLYVSGLPGVLYRLRDDGTAWDEVAKLDTPRFFHRLLPAAAQGTIMAVAGSADDGHVSDIELIDVEQ